VSFDLGDVVPLELIVKNAAGVNANAGSVALSITQPDGTAATITNPVAPASTGVYDYDFTPTQRGVHSVHWVATGANAGAYDDAFYVEAVSSKGILTFGDLPASLQTADLIHMMLAGANAKVVRVAPCLVDPVTPPSAEQLNEARLVLVGAIKRWVEAGAGSFQSETVGPFGHTIDTRQRVGFNLWPSEINQLQDICATGTTTSSGAFSITPYGGTGSHLPWCSLNLGALHCSCGVDIAGYPIFELADGDYY
jgi:hypothetical protein